MEFFQDDNSHVEATSTLSRLLPNSRIPHVEHDFVTVASSQPNGLTASQLNGLTASLPNGLTASKLNGLTASFYNNS